MTAEPDLGVLTLGPNDLLAFSVYGRPEMSSPPLGVRVSLEGELVVPLLGPVHVDGLSEAQARERITEGLRRYFRDPVVTLSVLERSSKRFYVLGEVNQPGPQVMDRPLTALEALSYGQGIKTGALRSRIALLRRHGDGVEVHFFSHATPDEAGLVQVLPDDLIFVCQSGPGRFQDQVVPVLQGLGFTANQIASLILISDRK